jgi:predicted nucleotidyltransferase
VDERKYKIINMFNWQNITNLEKGLIETTLKAKDFILENIPNDEIVSIYLTGSLARREVNTNSDIDLIVILKTLVYANRVESLKESFRVSKTSITFSVLTLEELEKNIRFKVDL